MERIDASLSHLHVNQHPVSCVLITFHSLSVKEVVEDSSKRLDLINRLEFGHFLVLIKLTLVLTDLLASLIEANCASTHYNVTTVGIPSHTLFCTALRSPYVRIRIESS